MNNRFTGKISNDLHNSAIDEVRQALNDLQDFNTISFEAKLTLFQSTVEKLGGDKSKLFQDLNKKYDCELTSVNYVFWNPK